MPNKSYKILIVEDDVIIAQLIKKHLIGFGHHVMDIIFDSEKALDKISFEQPDLVLLDINILGLKDGIEVARVIDDKYDVPYIFLTALTDQLTLDRAKDTNPVAYVTKPYKESDLRASIVIGMSNHQKNSSPSALSIDDFNAKLNEPLTKTEFSILLKVAKGFTNVQIAREADVSINTIKWHTQNIYVKLDVTNRTAATQVLLQAMNKS